MRATPGTIAEGGEEDVSGPAIGTVLSAGIVDVFSDAAPAAWAQPDPPGRAIGCFWLAVAAAALVTGAYAAQVVVPAAETSPAPIAGIAPSYGPKTVSAVPNAAAIVRRIWLPGFDAGYDPQGLAVVADTHTLFATPLAQAFEEARTPPRYAAFIPSARHQLSRIAPSFRKMASALSESST